MEKLLKLRKFFHCFFSAGKRAGFSLLQLDSLPPTNSFLPALDYLLDSIYYLFPQNSQYCWEMNIWKDQITPPQANRAVINTRPAGEQSLYLTGLSHTSCVPTSGGVSSSMGRFTQPRGHELAHTAWPGFPGSEQSCHSPPFPRQEPFPAASNLKSHVIQIV